MLNPIKMFVIAHKEIGFENSVLNEFNKFPYKEKNLFFFRTIMIKVIVLKDKIKKGQNYVQEQRQSNGSSC